MTNYDKLLEEVRNLGMDFKWAKMFVKKLSNDEKEFPVSEEERKWALKRGFYPGRVSLYGINEDNYKDMFLEEIKKRKLKKRTMKEKTIHLIVMGLVEMLKMLLVAIL